MTVTGYASRVARRGEVIRVCGVIILSIQGVDGISTKLSEAFNKDAMKALNFGILVLVTAAWADDDADRAKLAGAWQLQDATAKEAGTWNFQNQGEKMQITHVALDQTSTQYECGTSGRECDFKDPARSGKVSFWFNGAKLVQLETRGNEVVKRRFLVKDGHLEMEIIPISPGGKTETIVLQRKQ
jgi:hypothetical protein